MNASELRIGNYVFDRGGKILQIDRFYGNKIENDIKGLPKTTIAGIPINYHPYTEDIEYCKPIPLTEEWLIKFGFKKDKSGMYLSPYENSINDKCFTRMCFDFVEDKSFVVNSNAYDGFHIKCNYVNELQNIYFALTGQELELKATI